MKRRLLYTLPLFATFFHMHLGAMYNISPTQQLDNQVIQAIAADSLPALTSALGKGASPNVRNFMGDSALALAIKKTRPVMVQHLLNQRASMINVDREHLTALELAVLNNRIPIIDLLIHYNARITWKAFHYARHNSALCDRLRTGCNIQRQARESVKQAEPS